MTIRHGTRVARAWHGLQVLDTTEEIIMCISKKGVDCHAGQQLTFLESGTRRRVARLDFFEPRSRGNHLFKVLFHERFPIFAACHDPCHAPATTYGHGTVFKSRLYKFQA